MSYLPAAQARLAELSRALNDNRKAQGAFPRPPKEERSELRRQYNDIWQLRNGLVAWIEEEVERDRRRAHEVSVYGAVQTPYTEPSGHLGTGEWAWTDVEVHPAGEAPRARRAYSPRRNFGRVRGPRNPR